MTAPPPQGQMYLFDSITPPLQDGSYHLNTSTDVTYAQGTPGYKLDNYFDVVGPRFTVPAAMVAGTFPPANSHGEYQGMLPHIVLSRRTLPWERAIAPDSSLPVPTQGAQGPPQLGPPVPWVALLLFEEGEYTLNRNVPLDQAVPASVFTALGRPANITCDAVTASLALVRAIMPSIEELQLLAHGRWVNVDDRELNTAGGDGFFSVVVANRIPQQQGQYRAFLVSLEGRTDLLAGDPPPVDATPGAGPRPVESRATATTAIGTDPVLEQQISLPARNATIDTSFTLSQPAQHTIDPVVKGISQYPVFNLTTSLVVLSSWKFTSEGPGPFRRLMQNLDDAMFGTVQDIGHPAMSDTGHLQVNLQDRLGAMEQAWYRGPLVPWQLSRDNLGPYHSADQCRRVTPETGAEDISYAAAFEVGRLLAAADPRLAQALMRWRRESYKQSARASTITEFNSRVPLNLPATLAEQLHTPIVPLASATAVDRVVASGPIIADAYGTGKVANAPGLNAEQLAQAWQLASPAEAQELLSGESAMLGGVVAVQPQTVRSDTNLSEVAADTASLERLSAARTQTISNAVALVEEN